MTDSQGMKRYEKKTLLMTVFTAFLTTFISSALNLSVPAIETEFNTNAVTVGWIITGYSMGCAVCCVPFGKLADTIGRKKVLVGGLVGFLILSFAIMFSKTIAMLIILRFFQGCAAACLFATNNAILLSVFPPENSGKMLGISVAATYTGLSLGPVVGGFLNTNFGWRSILIVTVATAILSLFFAVTGTPNDDHKVKSGNFDLAGSVTYMLMVGAFLLGFSSISTGGAGKILVSSSVVLAIIFVIIEKRNREPVIKISMFTGNPAFAFTNIAALLNYSATFAVTYLISIYLQMIMGFTSQHAGLILVALPVVQAVLSPVTGKLSDRLDPGKIAASGMTVCMIGLFMFGRLKVGSSLVFLIIALMITGLGFALFSSPNTNAVMSMVEKRDYSIANSILSTMRTIGQSFSMVIVNLVVAMNLSNIALTEATPKQLTDTIRICFMIFVVLSIIGTIISLVKPKRKVTDEK